LQQYDNQLKEYDMRKILCAACVAATVMATAFCMLLADDASTMFVVLVSGNVIGALLWDALGKVR
jgi:hypothetical protein